MGKKIALGCLGLFVVVLIAGGGFLYFKVLRPAGNVFAAAQSLERIGELEDGVRNRANFEAPANGLLSEAAVERYLGVQEHIESALAGRLEQLEAKYAEFETSDREPNLSELAGAWADVMNLLVDAKAAQVAALNELDFSLAEYDWVRSNVLQAAGFAFSGYDLDTVLSGSEGAAMQVAEVSVPEANARLVEPYVPRLERFLSLAYFGL